MNIESKKWFYILILAILITDSTILLDIPFLRQIFGFLFLTILPGLLILQILKLDKIGLIEKWVLSVGLSISFLMFFGLLLNNLSLGLGYLMPLGTVPLLISFNVAFIVLAIIGHKVNKEQIFSLPNLNLSTSEKAFLIVPIFFPALSIFGMHVMNTTDNNIILMFMLFLIPTYVAFVCFFNRKFPKRLYPVVILLISLSLLLLFSLRSNYLIGVDTHVEYYYFQTTLDNLHWSCIGKGSPLNACLAIALLPAIYQSILNVDAQFLFKILYSLLFSISPVVIYVISKRYVGELYAFFASFSFMSLHNFLSTPFHARTNTAILFFALAMMVLFSAKIDPLKKRILFIVFMASCMVSHYSTTYIFFFIMLGTFIGMEILSKKYVLKKVVSLTIVFLFFAMIFFWYSQVTETAFDAGVKFIENTLSNLNEFFVDEMRSGGAQAALGEGIMQKGIPHKIEFVFTWLSFAFIGIGIITLMRRYKEMSFPERNFKKPEFLKDKFEVGYSVIALICSGLFVLTIALPYVTVGYGMTRVHLLGTVILSTFFVIGGMMIAKYSKVRAYLVILLILIPYFFCVTGVMYQVFGVPRAITLNSEGEEYVRFYIHDQDSCAAKWLKGAAEKEKWRVYGDRLGTLIMISQATKRCGKDAITIKKPINVKGYVYLYYDNIINDRLYIRHEFHNLTEYQIMFVGKSKIYDNDGSEIYK